MNQLMSALIAIRANNNKIVDDGGSLKSKLSKFINIKKILKSQRFETNFLGFDASSVFLNLNSMQNL